MFFSEALGIALFKNSITKLKFNGKPYTYCNMKDVHIETLQPQLSLYDIYIINNRVIYGVCVCVNECVCVCACVSRPVVFNRKNI